MGNITADLRDRACGCILAGALGDAMGGPFEGQAGPLTYADHRPWSLSDDTQLTLAACEAVAESGCVSPERIAAQMLAWFRAGRISGVGASTLKALRDLDAGAHWALSGARGERAAGCGAAMRVAPLAFLLNPGRSDDRQTLRDVCRITHHHEEAYVGGLAVVAAVRFAAKEAASLDEALLPTVAKLLPDSCVRDRLHLLAGLDRTTPLQDVAQRFGCSGYVAEAVPLALYAAGGIERKPLFDVLREVIEVGGDTDTIAAMASQVAGARIGASRIPQDLLAPLPNVDEIFKTAEAFSRRFV